MSGPTPIVDPLPPINGEVIPPDEAETTRKIVALVKGKVLEGFKTIPVGMRDAHPKGHGCVRAEFRILDDVPVALRVGLFARPGTYNAWIRYSNGNPGVQKDSKGDGRGMAIKLMGVADSPSTTQDFILINHPVFAARNVADYFDLERANPLLKFFFPSFNPLRWRLHEGLVTIAILLKRVNNLLNIRYWSMSAYRFGDSACKYSARPVGPASPFTGTSDPNFLRVNLARHLVEREASFDFMVQMRTNPKTMPVEDPTIKWDEAAAPFVPVARITIPKQSFDSVEQVKFCENLSFTPWHCMDAHRPLGGLNRLRRVIYEAISALRHELNHAPRKEPVNFTIVDG